MIKLSSLIGFDLRKFLISRAIINANSGGGKSWLIRWILEQTHGEVQQIVLDLEGEFSTLREKYDYLLVGPNGEIPASIRTAELLARKLLELNVSTIIDLSELKHAERITFVKRFLDSMINSPKELWHEALVVVDEAHQFCPEKGHAESASAVIDLMTRGRKRGFCGILATQRISKLHKDAVAEANNYFVGRAVLDIDAKRAGEILGLTSKEDVRGLRELKAGEFYVFGSAFNHSGIERVQIGKVATTHDKQFGNHAAKPVKTPENIKRILKDVVDLPKEAEVELRSLSDHKREISILKTKLTLAEKGVVKTSDAPMGVSQWREYGKKYGYVDFFTDKAVRDALIANDRKWQVVVKQWKSFSSRMLAAIEIFKQLDISKIPADAPEELPNSSRIQVSPAVDRSIKPRIEAPKPLVDRNIQEPLEGPLRAGAMKMLNWVAGAESLTKQRLATLSGFSATGGTFLTYLSELKRKGWVLHTGDLIIITDEGKENATAEMIPSGELLLDLWKQKFRQGAAKILEFLFENHPNFVSKEEIGAAVGFEPTGGTFTTYISELKRNGLIVSDGSSYKVSDEFFG